VRTDFTGAFLRHADLRGAQAIKARFVDADLHGAHLAACDLTGAEMDPAP
jgi:uncharacterized protein YjbI with pentapeptide repeats